MVRRRSSLDIGCEPTTAELAEKLALPVACYPGSLIGAAAIFSSLRTPSYIRRDSEVMPPSFAQIGLPILEPLGAQLRVPHRVLYRAVAEPVRHPMQRFLILYARRDCLADELISLAAVPLALTLRKVKLGGAAPMGH